MDLQYMISSDVLNDAMNQLNSYRRQHMGIHFERMVYVLDQPIPPGSSILGIAAVSGSAFLAAMGSREKVLLVPQVYSNALIKALLESRVRAQFQYRDLDEWTTLTEGAMDGLRTALSARGALWSPVEEQIQIDVLTDVEGGPGLRETTLELFWRIPDGTHIWTPDYDGTPSYKSTQRINTAGALASGFKWAWSVGGWLVDTPNAGFQPVAYNSNSASITPIGSYKSIWGSYK